VYRKFIQLGTKSNYTNIFKRLIKNRIDIDILYTFLDTLKQIEEEKLAREAAKKKEE
jgi:hypothetical protein